MQGLFEAQSPIKPQPQQGNVYTNPAMGTQPAQPPFNPQSQGMFGVSAQGYGGPQGLAPPIKQPVFGGQAQESAGGQAQETVSPGVQGIGPAQAPQGPSRNMYANAAANWQGTIPYGNNNQAGNVPQPNYQPQSLWPGQPNYQPQPGAQEGAYGPQAPPQYPGYPQQPQAPGGMNGIYTGSAQGQPPFRPRGAIDRMYPNYAGYGPTGPGSEFGGSYGGNSYYQQPNVPPGYQQRRY